MNLQQAVFGHRTDTHDTSVCTGNGKKLVQRKTTIPSIAKVISRFLSSRTEGGKNDCWNWNKSTNEKGYGQVMCAGKNIKAHKMAYMIHVGDIPDGVSVLHKCDNPRCVNPNHLFLGSQADNINDMYGKKRAIVGSRHKLSKLTEQEALEIFKSKESTAVLANRFSVCAQLVNAIKRKSKWKHLHAEALSVRSPLELAA